RGRPGGAWRRGLAAARRILGGVLGWGRAGRARRERAPGRRRLRLGGVAARPPRRSRVRGNARDRRRSPPLPGCRALVPPRDPALARALQRVDPAPAGHATRASEPPGAARLPRPLLRDAPGVTRAQPVLARSARRTRHVHSAEHRVVGASPAADLPRPGARARATEA